MMTMMMMICCFWIHTYLADKPVVYYVTTSESSMNIFSTQVKDYLECTVLCWMLTSLSDVVGFCCTSFINSDV